MRKGFSDGRGPARLVLFVWLAVAHFAPVGVCSAAPTYELLHGEIGPAFSYCFGSAVAGVGDIDRDGYDDFIVGAPSGGANCYGATEDPGNAYVFSGLTGRVIFHLQAGGAADRFGTAVAGGRDLDGDGLPDFIVGAPGSTVSGVGNAGAVFVYSGASGQPLYSHYGGLGDSTAFGGDQLGGSVALAEDVDGDGREDFIAGAPEALNSAGQRAGSVFVYSGANGDLLFRKDGADNTEHFATAVASGGDLNGDGRSEILIGAPDAVCGAGPTGSVFVLAGPSGALFSHINAPRGCSSFGASLSPFGDSDGDGIPDFVVGSPLESYPTGAIRVYSGATSTQIRSVAFDGAFGTSAAGGDVNGDGTTDIIGGAPEFTRNGTLSEGTALVFSGVNDSLLFRVDGTSAFERIGAGVAKCGDTNGDGRVDLIAGAPGWTGPGDSFPRGAVFLYGFIDIVPGRAFTGSGDISINLNSGNAPTCLHVEPVGGAYLTSDVISSTLSMRHVGGVFREAVPTSVDATIGDTDGDGVSETSACFAKDDLRRFFNDVPVGTGLDSVVIEGNLRTGARFRAPLQVRVVVGRVLVAKVTPNPIRASGTLTFRTASPGSVKVRLFDSAGRLVRTLLDDAASPAGYHDVPVNGVGRTGRTLPSGIYFYQIESPEGTNSGRFLLLR